MSTARCLRSPEITNEPLDLRNELDRVVIRRKTIRRKPTAKHRGVIDGLLSFIGGIVGSRSIQHPRRRVIITVSGALADDWHKLGTDMTVSMKRVLDDKK